jgi:regulator of sigma E protease
MLSLILFFFMLSVLIIVHEFGHFIMARRAGVRVEEFSLGFGRKLFRKRSGDTEYSVACVPLGGFVKMAGDSQEEYSGKPDEYLAKRPGQRFNIIFFGPLLNYALGLTCFCLIFFLGYPTLTTRVGGLVEGYGAQKAGIQAEDVITAVDGKKVRYFEDLQQEIHSKKEATQVELTVSRSGQELKVLVNIRQKDVDDPLGQKRSVGLIGITPYDEVVIVKHGPVASFILGVQKTWDLTVMTYRGLWLMVTGQMNMKESMTGPLGIFYITSKAARLGIIAVMHLMAVLSVSLAIFNLLPFPVLDGGHLLFLGLEKIRGRALSLKAERVVTQVGVSLIITLAVFVTYNDIMRLFGDKITGFFK